jgi:hypothetical protein
MHFSRRTYVWYWISRASWELCRLFNRSYRPFAYSWRFQRLAARKYLESFLRDYRA